MTSHFAFIESNNNKKIRGFSVLLLFIFPMHLFVVDFTPSVRVEINKNGSFTEIVWEVPLWLLKQSLWGWGFVLVTNLTIPRHV